MFKVAAIIPGKWQVPRHTTTCQMPANQARRGVRFGQRIGWLVGWLVGFIISDVKLQLTNAFQACRPGRNKVFIADQAHHPSLFKLVTHQLAVALAD